MKTKEFIKELKKLRPSFQEMEILIRCENGLLVEPKAKMFFDEESPWPWGDPVAVIISPE